MAMAPRFITEAFGRPATSGEFRYQLLTCATCRCGIAVVPEAPCGMQDLPWGPPHVSVPGCVCAPLSDADNDNPKVPRLALRMILAHDTG